MVCPPKAAYDLHKAWPESRLYFIPAAGHASSVSTFSIQSSNFADFQRNLGYIRSWLKSVMNTLAPRLNVDLAI